MTELEERYVFSVQCSDDLNEAWRLARELLSSDRTSLTEPAFKYLLVAYSRPFKTSRGAILPRYKLEAEIVPEEHRALHKRLIDARDQVLAHSDLSVLDAQVHFHTSEFERFPVISQNNRTVLDEFWNLTDIVSLTEVVLERLYERIREIEGHLELAAPIRE